MAGDEIEIIMTIPKRYYDIAVEIESLPEVKLGERVLKEGSKVHGYPNQAYGELLDAFEIKVSAILKREKIKTFKQRDGINRARKIIQLRGVQ